MIDIYAQVDREIRPISLAPERVGLQQAGAGQLGPHVAEGEKAGPPALYTWSLLGRL